LRLIHLSLKAVFVDLISDWDEATTLSKELREEIVKSAREMVKERYNWDIITDKMKNEIFASIRI